MNRLSQLWTYLAHILDVPPDALEDTLARLGLPQRAWILVLAQVGWKGDPPPGAEILAEEGLVDLETRWLTKKGKAVLKVLEAMEKRGPKGDLPLRDRNVKAPSRRTPHEGDVTADSPL